MALGGFLYQLKKASQSQLFHSVTETVDYSLAMPGNPSPNETVLGGEKKWPRSQTPMAGLRICIHSPTACGHTGKAQVHTHPVVLRPKKGRIQFFISRHVAAHPLLYIITHGVELT